MPVSAKVATRIAAELKRYQSILTNAKQRDVSESNTVTIITDMISDVLGYDKYHHVTSEHSIRGTYVDLAVVVDEDIRFLVEAKAIGIELKDSHVKQAIDYGANKGTEWVLLTNGAVWRLFKIQFGQPIDKTLVFEIDILTANPKDPNIVDCIGSLCLESFSKDSMSDLLHQKQLTSRFAVAAILQGDAVLDEIRREMRRLSPGLKVETEYLCALLGNEIIKRELIDSEEAKSAASLVKRLQRSLAREKKKKSEEEDVVPPVTTSPGQEQPVPQPMTPATTP